jgi:hypothetical protein
VTLAPRGLLVEEARTNLLLRSEEFDNAAWTKSGSSVSANATTAPDGTLTADKLQVLDTSNSQKNISQTIGAISTTYADTVYAKAAELSWLVINQFDGADRRTWFNLSNGTVGTTAAGTTASIQALPNGWYRCTAVRAMGTGAITLVLNVANADNSAVFVGTVGQGIFVWGAQREAGAFATSYIPTIASTATRSADVATITGSLFSQWWNNPTGTLIVDYQQQAAVSGDVAMTSDGTPLTNSLGIYGSSTNDVGWCRTGGVNQALISIAATITNPHKAAFAYATNDFALSSIGGAVSTDTSGTIPTINQIRFGVQISGGQAMWLRSFRYVPVRAADFQLQQVTT